jgi:cytochrome c oxidase subunit III
MDQSMVSNYSGPDHLTPARIGIWALIASEIVLFAGLLGSFMLFRMSRLDWAEESTHLNVIAGTANTLILLFSNFFMMKAAAAVDEGKSNEAKAPLALTILLGLTFLAVKAYEYSVDFAHGETPSSNSFWSFYFLLTGVHGLHIIGGCFAITLLWARSIHGTLEPVKQRVFLTAMYWSFVEIVWFFLFPLLYLVN